MDAVDKRYPTYVRAIIDERDEAQAELETLRGRLDELVAYLNSSKFHVDPTVQVVDVLTRLGRR